MSLYNDWKNDNEYRFNTVAQGDLPMSYNYIRLEAQATYDVARIVGGDAIYSQWRRIYPRLPSGIVDDPRQYGWLIFKTSIGETVVLANCWIEGSTVESVNFRQERIILTDTSEDQILQVKAFLNAIGAKYTSEPILQ